MKAGVVMAPVNWRLAGPEIAFIVEDCKAPLLFVGPEFVTMARGLKDKLPGVRAIITTEGGAPEWQDALDGVEDSSKVVPASATRIVTTVGIRS